MTFPTSDRLIFKAWKPSDFEDLFRLTSNEKTQRFFPKPHTEELAQDLFARLTTQFDKYGYTYFPVYEKATGEFIGFIGCALQDEIHELCPFVDIGWRLLPEFWGKGFATEGAKACLDFMFAQTEISQIYSMATKENLPSIAVMKKLGMEFLEIFDHPKLKDYPSLQSCELFKLDRSQWLARDQS